MKKTYKTPFTRTILIAQEAIMQAGSNVSIDETPANPTYPSLAKRHSFFDTDEAFEDMQ